MLEHILLDLTELQNLRVGGSSDSADGDTIGPLPYNFPWSQSSHSDEQSYPPPYESKGSPSLYKSTKSSKSSSSPEGHSQYKGKMWFSQTNPHIWVKILTHLHF